VSEPTSACSFTRGFHHGEEEAHLAQLDGTKMLTRMSISLLRPGNFNGNLGKR
jgi:hypothetical protein